MIYIVDGNNIFHRLFELSKKDSEGNFHHTTFAFANWIKDKFRKYNEPDELFLCFDYSGRYKRNNLYEPYKQNRPRQKLEEKLRLNQISQELFDEKINELDVLYEKLQAAIQVFTECFCTLIIEGYEADDVIASLIEKFPNRRIKIFSNDKDLCQLVGGMVTQVINGKELDRDGVKSKYGLYPEQILDHLCLMGDTSDNIPGAKGIGENYSKILIGKHDTSDFEDLIHWVESEPERVIPRMKNITLGEKLRGSRKSVEISRKLATLERNLFDEVPYGNYDIGKLNRILKRL